MPAGDFGIGSDFGGDEVLPVTGAGGVGFIGLGLACVRAAWIRQGKLMADLSVALAAVAIGYPDVRLEKVKEGKVCVGGVRGVGVEGVGGGDPAESGADEAD